ncbi:MAG: PKD domain-containing protein [Halobacteria archaeon]
MNDHGSVAAEEEAEMYLTSVKGNGSAVALDTNSSLGVEVRDRYNNPVSGVEVEAVTPIPGLIIGSTTQTTDTEGRANFLYRNSGNEKTYGTRAVSIRIVDGREVEEHEVTYRISGLLEENTVTPEIKGIDGARTVNLSKPSQSTDVGYRIELNRSSLEPSENHSVIFAQETKPTTPPGEIEASDLESYPVGNLIRNYTGEDSTLSRLLYYVYNSTELGESTDRYRESLRVFEDSRLENGTVYTSLNFTDGTDSYLTALVMDEKGGYQIKNVAIEKTGIPLTAAFDVDPEDEPEVTEKTLNASGSRPSFRTGDSIIYYNWSISNLTSGKTTVLNETVEKLVWNFTSGYRYGVGLRVYNGSHTSEPYAETVDVNRGPNASIEANRSGKFYENQTLRLDGTGSDDDTGINRFNWSIREGSGKDESPRSPTTVYRPPNVTGKTPVKIGLEVKDHGEKTDVVTRNFEVLDTRLGPNQPPVAELDVNETSVNQGESVLFDSGESRDPDGNITNYSWSFSDASPNRTTVQPSVAKTFDGFGTYSVLVRVTDERGSTDTATESIDVNGLPVIDDLKAPEVAVVGEDVGFRVEAEDPDDRIEDYVWHTDGESLRGEAVVSDFSSEGLKPVTVTVMDTDGATSSKIAYVEVVEADSRYSMVAKPGVSGSRNRPPCGSGGWNSHFGSSKDITDNLGVKPYRHGYERVEVGRPYSFKICGSTDQNRSGLNGKNSQGPPGNDELSTVEWTVYHEGGATYSKTGQAISYGFPENGRYTVKAELPAGSGNVTKTARIQEVLSRTD